jgi:hypothetical protein
MFSPELASWLWTSSVATHRPRWGRRAFTDRVDLEECKCKLRIAEVGEGLLPQASCLLIHHHPRRRRHPPTWCWRWVKVVIFSSHHKLSHVGKGRGCRGLMSRGGIRWLTRWREFVGRHSQFDYYVYWFSLEHSLSSSSFQWTVNHDL